MSISAINSNFKGTIFVKKSGTDIKCDLDTDKIQKIEKRDFFPNKTSVTYLTSNQYRHRTPLQITVDADLNTMINAYAAAKNSNIKIDLTEKEM